MANWNRSRRMGFLSGGLGQDTSRKKGADGEGDQKDGSEESYSDWFSGSRARPIFETLEPRLLLSGDFAPGLADMNPGMTPDTLDEPAPIPHGKGNLDPAMDMPSPSEDNWDEFIPKSNNGSANTPGTTSADVNPAADSNSKSSQNNSGAVKPSAYNSPPNEGPAVTPDSKPVSTAKVNWEPQAPTEPPGLTNNPGPQSTPPGLSVGNPPQDHFSNVPEHAKQGLPPLLLSSITDLEPGEQGRIFGLKPGDPSSLEPGSKPDFGEGLAPGLSKAAEHHDFSGQPSFGLPEQANVPSTGPAFSLVNTETAPLEVPSLVTADNPLLADLPEGVNPKARFLEFLKLGTFNLMQKSQPQMSLASAEMPIAVQAPMEFAERFPNLFLADEQPFIPVPVEFFDGANYEYQMAPPRMVFTLIPMPAGDFMDDIATLLATLFGSDWFEMMDVDLQFDPNANLQKLAMISHMTAFLGMSNMLRSNKWDYLINPGFFIDPHQELPKPNGFMDVRGVKEEGSQVPAEAVLFDSDSGNFNPNADSAPQSDAEDWVFEETEHYNRADLYRVWDSSARKTA